MVTRLRNGASGSASRPRRSAPRSSRKPRGTDAETTVAVLAQELDEARQQQAATADVLKVIGHPTSDLQSVFDTLSALAARLCEADIVTLWRPAGPGYRLVARCRTSRAHDDYMANLSLKPGRGSCVGRALLEAKTVHIPDIREDPEYTLDDPRSDLRERLARYSSCTCEVRNLATGRQPAPAVRQMVTISASHSRAAKALSLSNTDWRS